MANLKSGTLIGGNMIWHVGNLPFTYSNNVLTLNNFKVYTEAQKPTPAEVGAVNKAGDTMTGDLYAKNVIATLRNDKGYFKLNTYNNDPATHGKIPNASVETYVTTRNNLPEWTMYGRDDSGQKPMRLSISGHFYSSYAPSDQYHMTNKKFTDDTYVKKAGDTMTGALIATGFLAKRGSYPGLTLTADDNTPDTRHKLIEMATNGSLSIITRKQDNTNYGVVTIAANKSGEVYHTGNKPTALELGVLNASVRTVGGTDWDTLLDAGSYCVSNATGANRPAIVGLPTIYNYGVLLVQKTGDIINQLYIPDGSTEFYSRAKWGTNAWRAWTAVRSSHTKDIRTSVDLNDFSVGGTYNMYTGTGVVFTNAPSGYSYGTLEVVGNGRVGNTFVTQIYTNRQTNKQWVRTRTDGSMGWSEWSVIYNSSNKPTAVDVGALPTTGGMMTGVIETSTIDQFRGKQIGNVDLDTLFSETAARWGYVSNVDRGSANGFPSGNNANGVLYFNTHQGKYGRQIGFSSNGAMYTRFRNSDTWSNWRKMYDDANRPTAADVGALAANGKTVDSTYNNGVILQGSSSSLTFQETDSSNKQYHFIADGQQFRLNEDTSTGKNVFNWIRFGSSDQYRTLQTDGALYVAGTVSQYLGQSNWNISIMGKESGSIGCVNRPSDANQYSGVGVHSNGNVYIWNHKSEWGYAATISPSNFDVGRNLMERGQRVYSPNNKPSAADIGAIATSGDQRMNGRLSINNGSPTILFQDTDNLSAFAHVNSDLFYILRSGSPNGTNWDSGPNGRHPMTLSLTSGNVTFSNNVIGNYSESFGYAAQNTTKAPFFHEYTTGGTSEYHPCAKIRGVRTGGNTWTSSFGQLIDGTEVRSTDIHMIRQDGQAYTWNFRNDGMFVSAGHIMSSGDFIMNCAAGRKHIQWQTNAGTIFMFADPNEHILKLNSQFYCDSNGNFNDVYIRSDERLKSNVVPLEDSLNKILAMKPCSYDKKATLESEETEREIGLIAQEVEKIESLAVGGQDLKALKPYALISMLIGAVQELESRLKHLENK